VTVPAYSGSGGGCSTSGQFEIADEEPPCNASIVTSGFVTTWPRNWAGNKGGTDFSDVRTLGLRISYAKG